MKICVVGGAGFVGSALVPKLVQLGHKVTVYDTFWYGKHIFPSLTGTTGRKKHDKLELMFGDIRNPGDLEFAFRDQDVVIHLACISNDPSFELDPDLGKNINYDSFAGVLRHVKKAKVKRFIYASSSSVYGVNDFPDVTEETPCNPITDYSKFKLMCENDLKAADMGKTEWVIVRPATVCGYAPRLRLDLAVNILTINAMIKKIITVHGGDQLRPNINIKDMAGAYVALLDAPKEKVHGETFNVGFENLSIMDIAKLVMSTLSDPKVELHVQPTNDPRSYHVNSDKLRRAINFIPKYDILHAINSLVIAHQQGKIIDPLNNPLYYNIKRMQEKRLR